MVENYMNLTFCCAYMFTKGQRNVMRAYINAKHSGWITTTCTTPTGTEEANETIANVFIYPNPANAELSIENAPKGASYTICNILGERKLSGVISSPQEKINITSLPAGFYVFEIAGKSTLHLKFQAY